MEAADRHATKTTVIEQHAYDTGWTGSLWSNFGPTLLGRLAVSPALRPPSGFGDVVIAQRRRVPTPNAHGSRPLEAITSALVVHRWAKKVPTRLAPNMQHRIPRRERHILEPSVAQTIIGSHPALASFPHAFGPARAQNIRVGTVRFQLDLRPEPLDGFAPFPAAATPQKLRCTYSIQDTRTDSTDCSKGLGG